MFTPVRIRGKKFRKNLHELERDREEPTSSDTPADRSQERSEELGSVGDNLASSDHIVMEPTESAQNASSLSSLELLPLEILQSIFLLSENLNLPKASAHIGSALASTHARTELVLQAFGCKVKTELDDVGYRSVEKEVLQNVDLQTTLLRQKWLSYAFFKHCQKTYMLRRAVKLYRDNASGIPQDIQASTVADMVDFFDNYYNVHGQLHKQLKIWLQNAGPAERADKEDRTMVLQERHQFKFTAGNGIEHTIALLRQGSEMRVATPFEFHPVTDQNDNTTVRQFCPGSLFHIPNFPLRCELPEKLLHGPWTNERGQFLELLSGNGCSVDWVNSTSGEVATRGLEDAIREGNAMATRTLVGWLAACIGLPYVNIQDRFESAPHDFTDSEVDKIIAPQSKWNFQIVSDRLSKTKIGVVPTTRHLRIAVLEKGCDMRVLDALVSVADANIDYDDPEIIKWALQRKAEVDDGSKRALGRPEDKGSALLRLLDKRREWQKVRQRVNDNPPLI